MKKTIIATSLIASLALVAGCKSSTQEQIAQLQQTQQQMNDKASQDLDHAKNLENRAAKFNAKADQEQKQADALNSQVQDLQEAYQQFDDKESNDAISVREMYLKKDQQLLDIQKEIANDRNSAQQAQEQAADIKETADTEAKEAEKISDQIKTLQQSEN